jgi:hypothetical protein
VTSPVTLSTSNTAASYTSNTFILGADYVVFTNILVGAGGTITFSWTPNTHVYSPDYAGADAAAAFNGLQLVAVVPPSPGPRPLKIASLLTGNGTVNFDAGDTNFISNLDIAGGANTFSGPWNVVQGALLGGAAGSLGTNNITVGPAGALETLYNLNDASAELVLNGKLFLHESDTFQTVNVGGRQLSPGNYSSAQLTAAFPANFPATWPLQTGSSVSTASGSLTVLSGPPPPRPAKITQIALAGGNVTLSGTNGAASGTYRVLTTTNLTLPLSQWIVATNGTFNSGGNFNMSVPVIPSDSRRFYLIASP